MKLYLVRHGKTEANIARVHNTDDAPLSELGRQEASVLAKRMAGIQIDVIFTSPLTRAKETATIINNSLQKPIVEVGAIRERRWSEALRSKPHGDPEIIAIKQKIEELADKDPYARHGDEESFGEIRDRAVQALEFFTNRPEKNMLAVSHAQFTKILLAVILHGPDVPFRYAWHIYRGTAFHNTGITVCERHPGGWKLITINDKHHFGEYTSEFEYPHLA